MPVILKVKNILIITFLILSAISVNANVKLPYILSSNMVLQRETKTSVWGWASAGENVTVSFRGNTVTTETGEDGGWKVKIETGKAGGPFDLTIKGNNTILLESILVGDVWVCSGQSNMEFALKNSNNSDYEIRKANYPAIRLFQVPNTTSATPAENTLSAKWEICSPETAPGFSAVGYYFGKKINIETGIPIGLISADWGATAIESWTSEEALKTDTATAENLKTLKSVDQEKLAKEQTRIFEEYYINLWKLYQPDYTHEYLNPGFDDSNWMTLSQPQLWENEKALKNYNGVMWYRKSFQIPEGFNLDKASLSLARINDNDITWINGKRIGETFFMNDIARNYEVLPKILEPGTNQLVLRIEDYVGAGGIQGTADEMFLTDGKMKINLSGDWKLMKDETQIPQNPSVMGENDTLSNLLTTTLFNGMINPLRNLSIKGAIWYQGESNADVMPKALKYEEQLKRIIADWRKQWGEGNFPFYLVQLANYRAETQQPQTDIWPFIREAQANVAKQGENIGMACIIDIGSAAEIHPRNKTGVGERLALNALKHNYGKDIVCRGPVMKEVEFIGNKAVVTFDMQGSALKVTDKYGYINGFAVAGSDQKFFYSKAILISDNQVEVYADQVVDMKSVRFLWADNPGEINLYNSTGLPAEPFRTDNW